MLDLLMRNARVRGTDGLTDIGVRDGVFAPPEAEARDVDRRRGRARHAATGRAAHPPRRGADRRPAATEQSRARCSKASPYGVSGSRTSRSTT